MAELSDLSRQNDELMSSKDNDGAFIRELEAQVKEYKRKYEQAKTELRSAKGVRVRSCIAEYLLIRNHSDLATILAAAQGR